MSKKSEVVRGFGFAMQIGTMIESARQRLGVSDDDFHILGTPEGQKYIDKILVELKRFRIDCDADPLIPKEWSVEEHQKGGLLTWDFAKQRTALHLSIQQQNGCMISGNELRNELKGQPTLNANVLDFLLDHKHLIPETWKGQCVFFWGTIYRHSNGNLCVRHLYSESGLWSWGCYWLHGDWGGGKAAALCAS